MFLMNEDYSIYITRGDAATFQVPAMNERSFRTGDIVRIKVFGKKACENVVLQKEFEIKAEAEMVDIQLDKNDTKIGDVISKPKDYWYEVELNPHTYPQTIIGYDEDGAKIFRVYPEGADIEELPVEEGSDFERVVKAATEKWLKENYSLSDEVIAEVVEEHLEEYLEKNPVTGGATEEEAKQIWKNRDDIIDINKEIGDVELLLSGL